MFGTTTDDLAAVVANTRDAEGDPYSYAICLITTALDYALDDGIVDSMSTDEADTLRQIAALVAHLDPYTVKGYDEPDDQAHHNH